MAYTLSRVVTDDTFNREIHIESGGDPLAVAPNGDATGLPQFLRSTWQAVVAEHKPEWAETLSAAALLALREEPQAALEMLARFTEDNVRVLGPGAQDGDIYLAHFLGAITARKVLRAPAGDPISKYVKPNAIKANKKILSGKTVGQVRAWAAHAMAGAGGHSYIAEFWRGGYRLPGAQVAAEDAPEPVVDDVQRAAPEVAAATLEVEIAAAASTTNVWLPGVAYPEVEDVQRRLRARGYVVGIIDGQWGAATAGAIGAYKSDRHLPGPAVINLALSNDIGAAEIENWTRPIGDARREASDTTITQYAPEMGHVKQGRIGAFIAFLVTAVGSAVDGIMKFFGEAWEKVVGLQSSFGKVPGWAWLLIAAAVAGGLWWKSGQGEQTIRQAFKSGERL